MLMIHLTVHRAELILTILGLSCVLQLAWKRKIAIIKLQDGAAEAAKQLNKYLEK
jgi:hypothetical protein